MDKEDEHKTAFYALKGVYCYKKMPFGVKNARATYHRLMDKVFKIQVRRNMEACVGDMVIKSMDEEDMMSVIQETFETVRKINMKLNPKKRSFEMKEGQLLGHIVSKQGIKANPTKVQALTSLKCPKTIKEVQSLNGKLAALNRFLAKSKENSLPFFKTLKGCLKKKDFMWTKEAGKAFKDMKKYIEKLPTLVTPKPGESLIVYLAASKEYINAVLMEKRGKDQRPIYFMSRVLQGAELNYPIMEKLVLALMHAARRLKGYFQAHKITVLTNKPIRLLLLKPEKSGRMAKWAIELREHEIKYKPRNAIKAQVLADFLEETLEEDEEKDFQNQEDKTKNMGWRLYTDGASSDDESRVGLMIVRLGLQIAKEMKIEEITILVESQLVANQVNGSYEAKHHHIKQYLQITMELLRSSRRTSGKLANKSIYEKKVADATTEEEDSWMTMIVEYLIRGILPEDVETQQITILDPDDQPIWESAKAVAPTPNSAIVRPDVDDNFVINSTHMKIIWENKFDGYLWADPHDHIRELLAICDMFKYGDTQSEAVKLLIFPLSLCDDAKTWFNELNEESITSWEQMRRAFISRFFPPSLFNYLLLEIRNLSQNVCESLTDA
ncbi:reverse transcriptase domain-containing protein [Tanacetum coccineum]